MNGSPLRRGLVFAAFVLPALGFYALFFIYPFLQGIRISLTNWDGLTPRVPISLPAEEFETRILARVRSGADRAFLLEVFHEDPQDGRYKRFELTGVRRLRAQRILRATGWQPENYRFVGLANFADIFTGGVEARFYPRVLEKTWFNAGSDLPAVIPADQFARNLLPRLAAGGERETVLALFAPGEGGWRLRPEYDEFLLEDRIWLLPEVDRERSVPPAAVDALIGGVEAAGLAADPGGLEEAVRAFLARNRLSAASATEVQAAARALFELGAAKRLLADRWVERRFELGVVGFTLFFAFFNVVFANLLGFALALALDTRIRSRNLLRVVFFLPNVLSMIVVALVWSFVFFNLLPRITGIELWMGDPAKAPWLLVMVQVWQQAGYLMVIYLAGLQGIPPEVHEAARIDGAGGGQKLRRVVLPLLMPALTISLFLSLSHSLKSFDLVYAMVGPSGYALGTVPFVMDIFFDAFAKRMAGLATAKAMLLFLAILLITGVQLSLMKRREVRL